MADREEIRYKERQLEAARLDNQIAGERSEAAQKKALEAEMKKRYGKGWRKFLGIGVKADVVQSLYSYDSSLKDLAVPGSRRR